MRFDLLILAGVWTLWCLGHSLLAADPVKQRLCRRLQRASFCYRLFYNGVAMVTLIPVLVWSSTLPGVALLAWGGPWRLLQWSLWFFAGWLVWSGFRVYPLKEFLGIDGLRRPGASQPTPLLVTGGVLGLVRHPWYLAVLMLLWSRDLNAPALVSSLVLSGYLLVGALLEERRLKRQFGRLYVDYQSRVPMLVPWRWLLSRVTAIFRRWH
ncbi:methyltransferase family protein [Trichloromonas sp.]|uniref:methyltransferase family protein n=1 Tax=Trichloromonas sp. TaxID=3069249 RepID=UPI003D81786B